MIPDIQLHIEELVLHGFAASDRYLIGAAVQQELTRLFAENGVPPAINQNGEIGRLNGGAFNVPQGAKPEVIGIQVAQAIYGGLGK
ncbi:hypothetical protein H6G93_37960 [Nostoc sp. FACHB-973]|nr:hypothetical protein [Nostoc sp. FACHB-973]